MAKGATKTGENQAQQTEISAQNQQGQANAEQGQAYGALMPQIQSMLQPGGNPAVTAATMGALGSSFGSAKQNVMDTAARTNNGASTNASLDKLALGQGAATAQAAANNVMSQQNNATGLLSKLFGQTSANANDALGQRTNANNSYINAANSGHKVLSSILAATGAAGQAAGKALTGTGG